MAFEPTLSTVNASIIPLRRTTSASRFAPRSSFVPSPLVPGSGCWWGLNGFVRRHYPLWGDIDELSVLPFHSGVAGIFQVDLVQRLLSTS